MLKRVRYIFILHSFSYCICLFRSALFYSPVSSAVAAAATAAVAVAEIVKNSEYRDDDGKVCSVEKIAKATHIRSSFLWYAV